MKPESIDFKKLDEEFSVIVFSNIRDKNANLYWAYLQIEPSRFIGFSESVGRDELVQLTSSGNIIASGYGDIPPEEVQFFMEEEYGFDHKFEQHLVDYTNVIYKYIRGPCPSPV